MLDKAGLKYPIISPREIAELILSAAGLAGFTQTAAPW
jgi:hypothetical protein